ncbi:MAG: hypothetical protein NVSMB38_13870 [Ktedonobacteraceae bacterium]
MERNDQKQIGTILGTCRLKQVIGSGGMGVVYLAEQTRPTREVAVKVMQIRTDGQAGNAQEFLARFRREADVIAKLDHVNILPIYEYGEQDGLAYFVMPCLTGGSLRDRIKHISVIPLQDVLIYTDQIAAALDYAHAHNVVHRDIKPGNILFHRDGRLVLADFGIARIIRENGAAINETTMTAAGHFLGSVEYMAPEMVQGQHVDHRADIYELGILLFQMLSGSVPFKGDTPFAVAAKHLHEAPPLLYQINPAIPPSVDAVIKKAIAKRPEERYTSAGELARELRAATLPPYPSLWGETPTQAPTQTPIPATVFPQVITPPTLAAQPSPNIGYNIVSPSDSYRDTLDERTRLASTPRWLIVGVALLCLLAGAVAFISTLAVKGIFHPVGQTPQPIVLVSPTSAPGSTATPSSTVTVLPSPTLTPSQQAQAVVQQYYDAINQQNYQNAYQQWGSAYQNAHPYDQFANGFATTKHDVITIQAVTPQSDGTISVAMIINATQVTASGTNTAMFQGTYSVGQENGAWKLLTANFKQTATTNAFVIA